MIAGTITFELSRSTRACSALSLSASSLLLAVGETSEIVVTYAPAAAMPLATEITLLSNDPDESTVVIPATGSAVDPPIIVTSPTSLEESLFSGETITRSVTVHNDGAAELELSVTAIPADGPSKSAAASGSLDRFGTAFSAVANPSGASYSAGAPPRYPDRQVESAVWPAL